MFMVIRLKKTVIALCLGSLFAGGILPAGADDSSFWSTPVSSAKTSSPLAPPVSDQLPDIGTTAGGTLSINQELQMGDFYVRQMRASTPLINDPLLNQYINELGQRLVAHAYSVRTPFHFFIVNNDELNAFAFFGGNVVIHSSLFRYTENESQLASVMAHEISI